MLRRVGGCSSFIGTDARFIDPEFSGLSGANDPGNIEMGVKKVLAGTWFFREGKPIA
jgi:hypothetical protein